MLPRNTTLYRRDHWASESNEEKLQIYWRRPIHLLTRLKDRALRISYDGEVLRESAE